MEAAPEGKRNRPVNHVEPGEAALLIGLVERLIEDWYITHHEREQRLKEIVALKDAKERERHPRTPN